MMDDELDTDRLPDARERTEGRQYDRRAARRRRRPRGGPRDPTFDERKDRREKTKVRRKDDDPHPQWAMDR